LQKRQLCGFIVNVCLCDV